MKNKFSHQICIINLDHPFELIESLYSNTKLIIKLFDSSEVKIKRFIGSNINVDGSGFLWQGKNNNSFSFETNKELLPNFKKSYFFKIMYINNSLLKENIIIELSIYKNTDDNSTIIDYSFGQFAYNDYTKKASMILLGFGIKDYFLNGVNNLKNYIEKSNELIKINHSLCLNTDLETAYKIFRDFNYTSKALGTDKFWKIQYKDNSIYSVSMNNGVNVDFHIYKELVNKDGSKTLFIHKYPSLNEWIKIEFFRISENSCILVHETKVPMKINSSLHNLISDYTLYILKKLKLFIETLKNPCFI